MWFRKNGRDLPWRKTRDPYRVLVSELMLQQTQVSRVVPKYEAFLAQFPTLQHVANAQPSRVMEAWDGLGYYARARNLHRLARTITRDDSVPSGRALPSNPEILRELPGIGAYTAGAVASFAYEQRAALVDTNVSRVLNRLFAPCVNAKTGSGAKVLWSIAREILPRTGRATWTHNQALMELGALICTAKVRHCGRCPIKQFCPSATQTIDSSARRSANPTRRGGSQR